MRLIPTKLRKQLSRDPYMEECQICHTRQNIEWNHALIYGNKQINEPYAIIPVCRDCHRGEFGTIKKTNRDICELIAITRGMQHLTENYPKFDWVTRKQYLAKKIVLKQKI